MTEIGTLELSNESTVAEVLNLIELINGPDRYMIDQNLDKGVVVISTRENQTLEESTMSDSDE